MKPQASAFGAAIPLSLVAVVVISSCRTWHQPRSAIPHHAGTHPAVIRGLYLNSDTLLHEKKFSKLLQFVRAKKLNAVVMDAKDEQGRVTWACDVPLAIEIGACSRLSKLKERLDTLRRNHIYCIARVVVFADPLLSRKRPDLSIHMADGRVFRDRRGHSWANPYRQDVWDYNVSISRQAAAMGFSEIQFDYIRFPAARVSGLNQQVPLKLRTDAVEGFLRYAKRKLRPHQVPISADVFGDSIIRPEGYDSLIGQDYEHIASIVDYIQPMLYPSHYAPDSFGIANPNAEPGAVVKAALLAAFQRAPSCPVQRMRPWLQDFDHGKDYKGRDVEAQIEGLSAVGVRGWLLWNQDNTYSRQVDYDPPLNHQNKRPGLGGDRYPARD